MNSDSKEQLMRLRKITPAESAADINPETIDRVDYDNNGPDPFEYTAAIHTAIENGALTQEKYRKILGY